MVQRSKGRQLKEAGQARRGESHYTRFRFASSAGSSDRELEGGAECGMVDDERRAPSPSPACAAALSAGCWVCVRRVCWSCPPDFSRGALSSNSVKSPGSGPSTSPAAAQTAARNLAAVVRGLQLPRTPATGPATDPASAPLACSAAPGAAQSLRPASRSASELRTPEHQCGKISVSKE